MLLRRSYFRTPQHLASQLNFGFHRQTSNLYITTYQRSKTFSQFIQSSRLMTFSGRFASSNRMSNVIYIQKSDEGKIDEVLKQVARENVDKEVYFVASASVDPATGKLWCPDCVTGIPFVLDAFENELADKAVVVISPLEKADYRGTNPPHPFRSHPTMKLSAIPTIFRYDSTTGAFTDRLIEDFTAEAMKDFLKL